MEVYIIRYYPHNVKKIYQQHFTNVKNRACTYVYVQNDRLKKICSQIDKNIGNILQIERDKEDGLSVFQIILIDPNERQLYDIKKEMLRRGQQQLKKRIQNYTKLINDVNRNTERIDKQLYKYKYLD